MSGAKQYELSGAKQVFTLYGYYTCNLLSLHKLLHSFRSVEDAKFSEQELKSQDSLLRMLKPKTIEWDFVDLQVNFKD